MTKRNPRLRAQVFRRDGGKCEHCHLETEGLREAYLRALAADMEQAWLECVLCQRRYPFTSRNVTPRTLCLCGGERFTTVRATGAREDVEKVLMGHGYTTGDCKRLRASDGAEPSLWEADHVIPRAEKGPDTLENMRTLCLPCHRLWTKGLKRRLPHLRKMEAKKERTLATSADAPHEGSSATESSEAR